MIAPRYQAESKIQPPQIKKRHSQLLLPHTTVHFNHPDASTRPQLEQFVSQCFHHAFNADIHCHLPYFLSAYNEEKLAAALGFAPIHDAKPIFLEQYLDAAIETVISAKSNQLVSRQKVVELGNLSSAKRGFSEVLFIVIAAILYRAGYEWVVFTATHQVQRLVDKLKLKTYELCEADPLKLDDKGLSWGTYYHNKPIVLAGNLSYGMAVLRRHHVARFMLDNYQHTIAKYANNLNKLAH
jgi:hypothetical protein